MRFPPRLLPVLVLAGLASSSFAGYTFGSSSAGTAVSPSSTGQSVSVGSPAGIYGTFSSFVADGPADLQVPASEVGLFSLSANGSVTQSYFGGSYLQTGTYRILYDTDGNTTPNGYAIISTGTYSVTVNAGFSGMGFFSGTFNETSSSPVSSMTDLLGRYAQKSFSLSGSYEIVGRDAQNQFTFAQRSTPVPEPATLAALGLGTLALVRRRRVHRA